MSAPHMAANAQSFTRAVTLGKVTLHALRTAQGVSPSMALGLMQTRPALLIAVSDTQGCTGWGEIWSNFPPRANIHKAHLIEDVVLPNLTGLTFSDPVEVERHLRDKLAVYFLHIGQLQVFEHILAGLDTALWDLALRSAGRSFADHMNISPKAQSYASSLNRDDISLKLQTHSALGQTQFKLKLGFDEDQDCAFVALAGELCPAKSTLMVDSNQKWNTDRAIAMLRRLEPCDLLFAEEAIPANASLTEWERLAQASPTPLAAGENVYGAEEFLALANVGVRYLQPDVAKWGGVTGALNLAKQLPSGVRLWPHFMGTAVGQMAALSVTAAIGETSVCEMDVNANPLRSELCGDVLDIEDGMVRLPSTPGLVTPPDPQALTKFTEDHV